MSAMKGPWPENGFMLLETPIGRQPEDVLYPFAWDEALCRKVGEGLLPPAAHLWRHPAAMVLGLRDRRLPHAEEAMSKLRRQGLSVAVRNSGGAAVPLDPGVVNISLVFPSAPGKMDFHTDFRLMADLIGEAVSTWTDRTRPGVVEGAYCPGEYDLSIDGRKFCGIAQRRQLKGVVVSAFIVVEGSGADRGFRARDFYREATGGSPHPDDPGVRPETMASLQELTGVPSAEAFMESLALRLEERGGKRGHLLHPLVQDDEVRTMLAELKRRYDP